jgi:hypothetical protein
MGVVLKRAAGRWKGLMIPQELFDVHAVYVRAVVAPLDAPGLRQSIELML